MPLKLNVGLSRKIGEANYSSRGASVNVEMELESALVQEPEKFQGRIRQLFGMARDAVDEELRNGHGQAGNGTNGRNGSNGQDSGPPATASQAARCTPLPRSSTSIWSTCCVIASASASPKASCSSRPAS